jgi:hypothetical protein
LDIRVHKALYPNDDVSQFLNFGPRFTYVKDYVFRASSRRWTQVPNYSTDITAWDVVFKLKPEWEWHHDQGVHSGVSVRLYVSKFAVPVFEGFVYWHEAAGLAAWALGMARCVVVWAGL